MDGDRFDTLAKRLAIAGASRRRVLRGLGGGLLAALGGAKAIAADPACRGEGHPCEGNQICCAGLVCAEGGPGDARRCTAQPPAPTTTTTTTTAATTPPPCGPATCAGCCDASGACRPGTADVACGAGGRACAACGTCRTCSSGRCAVAGNNTPCKSLRVCCDAICCETGTICVSAGGGMACGIA